VRTPPMEADQEQTPAMTARWTDPVWSLAEWLRRPVVPSAWVTRGYRAPRPWRSAPDTLNFRGEEKGLTCFSVPAIDSHAEITLPACGFPLVKAPTPGGLHWIRPAPRSPSQEKRRGSV
jgi:hypothetical protein